MRIIPLLLIAILSLSGRAYATLGLRKSLPSEKNPKYLLWVELTSLGRRADGVPVKTLFLGNIEQRKGDGPPILFKFKRKIVLAWPGRPITAAGGTIDFSNVLKRTPDITGGMKGQRIWVKVQDNFDLNKYWFIEAERTPSGFVKLIKEEGEFLSKERSNQ